MTTNRYRTLGELFRKFLERSRETGSVHEWTRRSLQGEIEALCKKHGVPFDESQFRAAAMELIHDGCLFQNEENLNGATKVRFSAMGNQIADRPG